MVFMPVCLCCSRIVVSAVLCEAADAPRTGQSRPPTVETHAPRNSRLLDFCALRLRIEILRKRKRKNFFISLVWGRGKLIIYSQTVKPAARFSLCAVRFGPIP